MPPLSPGLCPLLTADVVAKLRQLGARTVADFVSMDIGHLSQRTGIPYKVLSAIRRSLLSQSSPHPLTAASLWEDMGISAALLPTGCSSIDVLLDGGVMTGELTEICGPPGSGKTQLCLSMAAQVVMETNSSVVLVDTSGGFSASFLQEVMVGRGRREEDLSELLERVQVYHTFSIFNLLTLIEQIKKRIAEQVDSFHSNLHVLMVDSVTALLSPLLGGHQVQGHALLSHLAMSLRVLAHNHSVAVVYTNNMVSDGGGGGVWGVKPALGLTWSHTPHTRLTLSFSNPTGPLVAMETEEPLERVATLSKSSRQPTGIATAFTITESGVQSTAPNS